MIPPVVHLAAVATDAEGHDIHYEWRVTDGALSKIDGDQTDWTLPPGPGLHIAYVLAGDGHGGYTEKRVIVSTDELKTPPALIGGPDIVAPPAADVPGSILRGLLRQRVYYEDPSDEFGLSSRVVHVPNLWARAFDYATGDVLSPVVQADVKGDVAIPKVPAGLDPGFECSFDAGATFFECGFGSTGKPDITGERALVDYIGIDFTNEDSQGGLWLVGHVTQEDATGCGTRNYFFDKDVTASVRVTDVAGNPIGPDRRWDVSRYGDYYVPTQLSPAERPLAALVNIECQGLTITRAVTLTASITNTDYDDASFVDFHLLNHAPAVMSLTASLNGEVIASLLPPGPPKPSDGIEDPERFLSYKGLDSRKGACEYYRAIGGVSGCAADGTLIGRVTFDRWKQQHGMAPYNTGTEFEATFVNKVDLNLTRNHHGIRVGDDHLAFYVCNHLGPADESQAAVDIAIDNAVAGRNLVACVAMDYSVSPGVNGDRPFIKYFIFGPSGELLPSVNLDGRREKFVPGVCVACHGGEHYAGSYPEDGSGVANVGASYLPFDVDNYAFSSQDGLRKGDQLAEIRRLNQLLLESNPTQGMVDLITAWYAGGGDAPDESYVPLSYTTTVTDTTYYRNVIKPYCRTCHVAYGGSFNSEDKDTFY
ncbi:MAG: hypothetical protein KDE53_40720, partial [Caldilineaceae bacterium]|nr:hypothetical protein [Caldilineaceae bacterium]